MEQIIEKPYVIGLDMGGTNSVFGIVDQRGTIKSQTAIKTQAYPDVKDYVKAAVEALQPALDVVGGIDYIKGMGIGAPNGNFYTGNIEYAANLVWEGVVPIAQMFEDALGVPCRVTNDANAAAMGEMTYGVARGMKNFIMITLGTGVGSGIVVDGKIVYGSDGFAGELGHFVVDHTPAGRKCGCGRSGCLETYCSVALEIFEFTGRMLGTACADFTTFNTPEAFVFFGGLTKAGDYLMNPLRKAYDENVLSLFKGNAKLLISSLNGSEAAVLGASALGWE